jgi:hypothetical protein
VRHYESGVSKLKGYIFTFARREEKYRTDIPGMEKFLTACGDMLVPDDYYRSTINSIYFDTPDWSVIRASMEKPYYREKLRLRTYGGTVSDDTPAFAEIKKKCGGITYKRRIDGRYGELFSWLSGQGRSPSSTQISNEIDYFLERHPGIRPAMQIAYNRLSYVMKDDPGMRITFDMNPIYRSSGLTDGSAFGKRLIPAGEVLMEVKISGPAMPLSLIRKIEACGIEASSFSKYQEAYFRTVVPSVFEAVGTKTAEKGVYTA